MIKLIIFDLDGTLIDSATDIMISANAVIQSYGRAPLSFGQIRENIGDGLKPLIQGLAPDQAHNEDFIAEVSQKFLDHYDTQLLKNTGFFPGGKDFIKAFSGKEDVKLGVVSNKPENQARYILENLGVEESEFVQIFGGDTFEVKKPHPKPLLEMISLAKAKPNETVMVGDSRQDIYAALAAGTQFIGVTFGYNAPKKLREYGARHFIDHFDELPRALNSVNGSTLAPAGKNAPPF